MWGATAGIRPRPRAGRGGRPGGVRGWHVVFWINVPVGHRRAGSDDPLRPRVPRPEAPPPGSCRRAARIVLLASLTYAIIEAPAAGWLSAQTIALGGDRPWGRCSPCWCTRAGAASRCWNWASSAAFLLQRQRDRRALVRRPRGCSCSSTPSTCRTLRSAVGSHRGPVHAAARGDDPSCSRPLSGAPSSVAAGRAPSLLVGASGSASAGPL